MSVPRAAAASVLLLLAISSCVNAEPAATGPNKPAAATQQQQYAPEYLPEHERPRSYDGPKLTEICLQRYKYDVNESPVGITHIDTFACCTPADDPKVCLYPAQHPFYSNNPTGASDTSFVDKVLLPKTAAVCSLRTRPYPSCPSVNTQCYSMVEFNCTLMKEAAECGCPSTKGLTFTSIGILHSHLGLTCGDPNNGAGRGTNAFAMPKKMQQPQAAGKVPTRAALPGNQQTPHERYVGVIQAPIKFAETPEGAKELHGSAQYAVIADVEVQPAPKPLPDLPFFKVGQMTITLLDKGHEEEPHY